MYKNLNNHKEFNIVFYAPDRENDARVIELLGESCKQMVVVDNSRDLSKHLMTPNSKVLFISLESFEYALAFYYELVGQLPIGAACEHKVVYLISRKDEEDAFHAYAIEAIDEYIVSRPLYEQHRPVLVVRHLLSELGIGQPEEDEYTKHLRQMSISEEVAALLKQAGEQKKKIRAHIINSVARIESILDSTDDRIDKLGKKSLDVMEIKQLLSSIRSDEIRPELLRLQDKTLSLLGEFIISVKETQREQAENMESDASAKAQPGAEAKSMKEKTQTQPASEYAADMPFKVLLVDNDEVSLALSAKFLLSAGIELVEVMNGREALKQLVSVRFDLILMDVYLPDSDGINIAYQIRTNRGPNKRTPLAILTASKSKLTISRASQSGFDLFLSKPLTDSKFARIKAHIKHGGRQQSVSLVNRLEV